MTNSYFGVSYGNVSNVDINKEMKKGPIPFYWTRVSKKDMWRSIRTGEQIINGKTYYFDNDGRLVKDEVISNSL